MLSIVPEKFHSLFLLNPMTGIIMGYQNVILYEKAPDLNLLIYPAIFSLYLFYLNVYIKIRKFYICTI
jgi:lipopolysaccharide transport system permease protein